MEKYFALDMPALRFARNCLVASLLGLIPILIVYVWLTPGFAAILLENGPARARFSRQIVTNGLPVVFAVNYLGFFLFACIADRHHDNRRLALLLLVDFPVRIGGFVLLHAVIYVLSADWFGSFGGSRLTALRVIPATLARSALFENLSGVYLYATVVSALPLYATVIERCGWLPAPVRQLGGRWAALAGALVLFGVSILALTAFATAILRWQQA